MAQPFSLSALKFVRFGSILSIRSFTDPPIPMYTDHTFGRFWLPGLVLTGAALSCLAQDKAPQAAPAAAATAPKPAAKKVSTPAGCAVADFRTLALDTHIPQERTRVVTQWLLKNGPLCREEQIMMIQANRAQWLGTSDTVTVAGLVDRLVEAQHTGRMDTLLSLYAAPTPERSRDMDVVQATGGTRPIVPPPAAAGMPLVLNAQAQAMPGQPAQQGQPAPVLRPDWNGDNR